MVTATQSSKASEGSALMVTLIFIFVACMAAGSLVVRASQEAYVVRRAIDYQKAHIAAESALEYGVMKLKDVVIQNQLTLPTSTLQYIVNGIPTPSPCGAFSFHTPGGNQAFQITVDSDVYNGIITNGSEGIGSEGQSQLFTVTAGAIDPATGVGAVLKQQVQAKGLFLIRYGVFYEEDLEINPGADMTFTGPVHCNQDMYLCPEVAATAQFDDRVTTHGDIFHMRKDQTKSPGPVYIDNDQAVQILMTIDSRDPTWVVDAIQKWDGRVLTKAHGVQHIGPPIASVDMPHSIIERALSPTNPLYQAQTEAEKFANKACLLISVSTSGVFSAFDCRGSNMTTRFHPATLLTNGTFGGKPTYAKDTLGNYLFTSTGTGSYSVAQTNLWDYREKGGMRPVDIYVDQLLKDFPQLADTTYTIPEGRAVVYVTRNDPDGMTNGVTPCLRLRNGRQLPTSGLTFASDMPIYIEGNYNVSNKQVALVAGDAVTMLSSAWQDARSKTNLNSRTPSNTTYNVVIMTGNSDTTWGNYNGGLENVLRFLENWSGLTVTYRGSVIDLWHAQLVQQPWVYGDPVYNAPIRNWGYDDIYRTQVPPGMTRVFGLEEIQWNEATWAQVGWN